MAGAGGGGSYASSGGKAGAPGTAANGGGGAAGGSAAGGTGGAAGGGNAKPGTPGMLGVGGNGGDGDTSAASSAGGGGGGGYYGGGGGGGSTPGLVGGGGGGGSSFVIPSATGVSGPTATSSSPVVSITYPVPTAAVGPSTLSFGTEPQGVASAEQSLTVSNNGSAPLVVSGVLLGDANHGDYQVDDGCQQPVAAGSSCQIGVRFAPQAAGASTASLTVLSNAQSTPAPVSLSGTGGSLPQGPAGTQGPVGPQGPVGQQGPAGTQGPSGKVELVTCKTVTKTVNGHTHKVQKCHGRLISGTVKFTTAGASARATLSRNGVVFASGASLPSASGSSMLVLNDRHPLRSGSYTLSVRTRHGQRWIVRRTRISLG